MNIQQIRYQTQQPSSVSMTLKRCAFEFNNVNASRTYRTLEGLLDLISKSFSSKISNQNAMETEVNKDGHCEEATPLGVDIQSLATQQSPFINPKWIMEIASAFAKLISRKDDSFPAAIIYNNNPVKYNNSNRS